MIGMLFGYIAGGPGTAVLWAIADISIVWLIGFLCKQDAKQSKRRKK